LPPTLTFGASPGKIIMTSPAPSRFGRACGLGLILALTVNAATRAEDIVLGMSAAFRGPSRGLSIELYRGSMAYFEHVNKSGGINGRHITIKAYDDGYDPIPALKNTIRLIEHDKVFLLYGYMGTPTTTRVLPLLKRYNGRGRHAYLFFPFTGAEPQRLPPFDDFVFNLRASYGQETAGLVDHFFKIGRQKIAVFYQVDAYGRSGWDGVRGSLAKHGLRMVEEATYRRGTPYADSMREQVEILRKSAPDAVIAIATYSASAAFIRDARDAGWYVPIANVSGVDSENLLGLLLEASRTNGRDYTPNLINSEVVPSYQDITLPAVQQYRDLMGRYKPEPPSELLNEPYHPPQYSFISLEGFLNAKLMVEILRKMGPNPQQDQIKQTVKSIVDFDLGINESVSFQAPKQQGVGVSYTVIAGGRFVPLKAGDWKRWAK
jgi:branched-chain amino acid transport system substrate-binding protein